MTRGAFAAVLKGNQLLLVMPPDWVEQYAKHWNFPGGVVNDNESLEQGAEREVFEETSIKCRVNKLIFEAINEKYNTEINIFTAEYVSGDIKIQEDEISQAKWFELEKVLDLPLAFEIRKVIFKLLDERKSK